MTEPPPLALVTGATGYVGGRLVPALLDAGHRVRCLARTPARLADRSWADRAETVRGDVTDPPSVAAALRGVDVAYYLVHALGSGRDFEETDRRAARVFAGAARAAGVRRIVYLGGLLPAGVPEEHLSPHLRSRAEVGRVLAASGVPTAVLRAAVIIGSGSTSFEMLRHLTERLPVMVTPSWVRTRVQPIAVADVLRLLVGCARLPADVSRAFDIGGPDVVTYHAMMSAYARQAGLPPRRVLPVPVLSPHLSSLWVGLVTPVPGRVARPLVESLRHEVVCRERDIEAYVPPPPGGPLGLDDALRAAVRTVRDPAAPPRARPASPAEPQPADPPWTGGSLLTDRRERVVHASQRTVWQAIETVAGRSCLRRSMVAWAARGWAGVLPGGLGRRLARVPVLPEARPAGHAWRVDTVEAPRLLRVRATIRVPGGAWLELTADPVPGGRAVYGQRAVFRPRGLAGFAYWWAVRPFHAWVFGGMARGIATRAEAGMDGPVPGRDR